MSNQTAVAAPPGSGPAEHRRGSPISGDWVRRNGVYLALIVLVILNIVITPHFVTTSNLRLQLIQTAPTLIVALGMAMVIGTGGIDLSVGSVMALAAAVMPLYLGYGTLTGVAIAMLCGAASGFLVGTLVSRVGLQPIVATLAILVGGRGLANVIGGQIKNLNDPGLRSLGLGSFLGVPYTVLVAAVMLLVVGFLVRRTTFGRGMEAIGGNRRAATLAGLPVNRILVTTYVVSGVLAAIAGILLAARSQASDPRTLGLLMELNAIAAVVIGGTPLTGGRIRVLGTLAGALLMQLITSTLVAHNIADSIAQMTQAVVIVGAVYVQLGRKTS
ncbi:monosaccharide ABC transporter membrane protein, CUT2 family [Georgenia satyanarayanai]|uniref:Monosaccharide ABC transporter membrane protein, CUT2 family n=1 Tax=Georgenia satyanarayanai TaxID=860221 RepID=A0A2Y9A6U0_9MICO|nr:ABC transporter permease [Georgenia satyanarayanai]PYG00596.1 monosaccharide ABC transporter membrane protein (CUT2 family) [Georgenia satyanarayanai]SSA39985.1 monosaccharide ABC transporter membrane protein, CUT2 family [Georgenia satyanarayanai]